MKKTDIQFPKKVKDFSCSKEVFELEFDEHYELLRTTPFPKNIDDYYPKQDYISHQNEAKGFVNSIYYLVKSYAANRKVKLLRQLVSDNSSVLDYGAGNGFLVNQLINQNWNAYGVEPSSYAREQATEIGVSLYASFDELPLKKFSAISLWHVLEHIKDYKSILHQLCNSLEEEGFLLLALPNYKSFDAKHYKSYWAAYDVPRHAYHFSRNSIEHLAGEFNLKLIKTKSMLFDSFYVSYLSEKNKGSKIPFIKGMFFGLLSTINGFFKKEHSSHLYLLQKPKNIK